MTRPEALKTINELTQLLDGLGETVIAARIREAMQALVDKKSKAK